MPNSKSKRKSVLKRERDARSSITRKNSKRNSGDAAYARLRKIFSLPFYEAFPEDEAGCFMVDMIFDYGFVWTADAGGKLAGVPEADLIRVFCGISDEMPEFTEELAMKTLGNLSNLGKVRRVDGIVYGIISDSLAALGTPKTL